MKLPVRDTHSTSLAIRITAPEYRVEPGTKRKLPLLCWADDSANQRRSLCSRALFLAAAGDNAVGEKPDGLDRLSQHHFYVHFDASEKAIGLDVIPARQFGSKIVPASQEGVTTLKLQWAADGSGIVRVIQSPVNTKPELVRQVITALDALEGRTLKIGLYPIPGNAAKILSLNDGVVEIRLSTRASRESVHAQMLED